MIKLSDNSFQPQSTISTATRSTGGTAFDKAVSTESEHLFESVLGESQALGTMASTVEQVETDQSDQKLIQLEEIHSDEFSTDSESLPFTDDMVNFGGQTLVTQEPVVQTPLDRAAIVQNPLSTIFKLTQPLTQAPEGRSFPVEPETPMAVAKTLPETGDKVNQPMDRTNLTGDKVYQTSEKTNQSGDKANQTLDVANLAEDKVYQTSDKANQTVDRANLTGDKVNQTGDKVNQTGDKVNQTGDRANLTGDRANLTGDKIHQTSDKANQTANVKELDLQQIQLISDNEFKNKQYNSARSSGDEISQSDIRTVSLSELRIARAENPRLRHSQGLAAEQITQIADLDTKIADKAIDRDKLSIKQPFNGILDIDEPILVDKFEVDKALVTQKSKPDSGEFGIDSIVGSLKDANFGVDRKIANSVNHTPISIQSMNGNLELSGIAAIGQKTEAALPITTLALRQPGLDQSLATNISYMINEDIQTARINVKPAELGPVSVQLAVRADHLSVAIAASQVQTRESLESTLPRLREQFVSMGFSSVDVNVGEHQNQRQPNENQTGKGNNPSYNGYYAGDRINNVEEISFTSQPRVMHNGMLDTFA